MVEVGFRWSLDREDGGGRAGNLNMLLLVVEVGVKEVEQVM